MRTRTRTPALVCLTDLTSVMGLQAADGSMMVATVSVDDPVFPVDPNHVRATLNGGKHLLLAVRQCVCTTDSSNCRLGGWHCRPVKDKPNQTLVTYFMNTDPK
jgi:hypothetical protein